MNISFQNIFLYTRVRIRHTIVIGIIINRNIIVNEEYVIDKYIEQCHWYIYIYIYIELCVQVYLIENIAKWNAFIMSWRNINAVWKWLYHISLLRNKGGTKTHISYQYLYPGRAAYELVRNIRLQDISDIRSWRLSIYGWGLQVIWYNTSWKEFT